MDNRDEARRVVSAWFRKNKTEASMGAMRRLEDDVFRLLGKRHRESFKEGANAGKEHLLDSMDMDGVDEI